jgi:hypothetical protein
MLNRPFPSVVSADTAPGEDTNRHEATAVQHLTQSQHVSSALHDPGELV